MATVTVGEETVIRRVVTVVLTEGEAMRVAPRLDTAPAILGDDGARIGSQITQALAQP